jgi:hypothetical protein
MALASVTNILVGALRRAGLRWAGLMTEALEALLASGLTDVAASRSEQVRAEWERIVAAVQKVAAGAA